MTLGTRPVKNARIPQSKALQGGGYLALVESQILGGGIVVSVTETGSDLEQCWAVTDFEYEHWVNVSAEIKFLAVPGPVVRAARATLDRFSSVAGMDVKLALAREEGLKAAIKTIVQEIPHAAFGAVAKVT